MRKDIAVKILEATLAIDVHLNELIKRLHELPDDAERKNILTAVGDVAGLLTKHIVFPIADQYPDLDPDK